MESNNNRCTTRAIFFGSLFQYILDKLDKELEQRGSRFTRPVDEILMFTKSEMTVKQVINPISSWLGRKLFLKVNATKIKVDRLIRKKYLGCNFLKNGAK